MRGRQFDVLTPWCLRAGRPNPFGRSDRVPGAGDVGDRHVDPAQVYLGVVADCPGEAGIPRPIMISESSQHSEQSLAMNHVEPERTYPCRVKPMLGRPWQSIAQSIENRPEVAHQM